MNTDQTFIHDLRNDLLIVQCLIKKMTTTDQVTERVNNVLKHMATKCSQFLEQKKIEDSLININQLIDNISSNFPNIDFEKNYVQNINIILNKIELQDILTNIISNSIDAQANKIYIQINTKSIIIEDNGNCSEEIVEKLNNGIMFTTKLSGNGIGTQNIRRFCEKNKCSLLYSARKSGKIEKSLRIEIKFP